MQKNEQTFMTLAAHHCMKQVVDYVCANEGVTQLDLVPVTGLSSNRIGEYLRRAAEFGFVHRLPREKRVGREGSRPLKWAGGPAPKPQGHVKSWKPQPIKHDQLHACFFGAKQ
jgi:hypothetical protein